jgi:cobalt-zinc-cadmium resistance protein CzcA
MLTKLIDWSIRARAFVLVLFIAMLIGGYAAAVRLRIDALPDISNTQVSVLTEAPGLSAVEVERTVTFPLENAVNGVPGMVELRSISRGDLSVVTVIFKDGTDAWFARQVLLERILEAQDSLPQGVPTPQLAPLTTGLGTIYRFVVRSPLHSPKQLRTILDWEIVPRLRGVPGVIEVATMGGQLKQYQVVVAPERLDAYGLSLQQIAERLRAANAMVSGGYLERGAEAYTLRAVGTFQGPQDIGEVVLKVAEGRPVLVRHIAKVVDGAALPRGVTSYEGAEAVTGTVMMLPGSNSREVVYAVKDRIDEISRDLPPGIEIEVFYDRADFIGRTLTTVFTNIAEGAAIVTVVLAILLGSLRGAFVVVLGIPAAMSVALFGMHAFGITGDLMSLGAIDFGFLVDGPIVILEALLAGFVGKSLSLHDRAAAYARAIGKVARPVAFAVAIIMLVYVPLLSLEGVEGKMFKPMALTMALALFGSLIYALVFLPALLVLLVPPPQKEGAKWLSALGRAYERVLVIALRGRWLLLGGSVALLVVAALAFARSGADFLPRIDEGDLVVTFRRSPSINITEARRLDLRALEVVRSFPEVTRALAQTGRAEVAVDPVGVDNTDIFIHLAPKSEWQTASDLDGLAVALKDALESEVEGTFVSVSQPIEDLTNEMISGSRADIQILVYGSDLLELKAISEAIAAVVAPIEGTGDIRVERVLGLPELTVRPDRARLARYGVAMEDALAAIEAVRVGTPLGWVFEDQRRFEVRLLVPPKTAAPESLGDLYVENMGGERIRLSEVARIVENEGPAQIRRKQRSRTIRVEVNLRGRDLVSWVQEAQSKVTAAVALPTGYKLEWGGQFENFQRAAARLGMVVPVALVVIFVMLLWSFGDLRYAVAVFAIIPFALIGGIGGLLLRDLSFSIPAAVGFIALAGIAVLNGVVLATEVRGFITLDRRFDEALVHGSVHTMRAVLTTGAVAALGFLPMALSTGAGSEVQRPLATVVVFGIGASTVMTMFLLPALLKMLLRREQQIAPKVEVTAGEPAA